MSLDPIRKITSSNINPANSAKPIKKIFLAASEVSEETQGRKETGKDEESKNTGLTSKNIVKKSTSPTKKAIEDAATQPARGLETGPNRFQSEDKQKAVEENMAKVAPEKNKKDDAGSPSTGSSSPALDPFSKPGGAGTALGQGSVAGNNNGIINNNTNYGNQGTQINNEAWTDVKAVVPETAVEIPPPTEPPPVTPPEGF